MPEDIQYGKNPFTPGTDLKPPYLAGRDGVRGDWRGWLDEMAGDDGGAGTGGHGRFVLMYGPRGMGKTALLDEFAEMAADEGVAVVRKNSTAFSGGPDKLADILLAGVQQAGFKEGHKKVTTSAGVGSVGIKEERSMVYDDPVAAGGDLQERLAGHCKGNALVVHIDEAHAVSESDGIEALKALVNAAQELAGKMPFTLVLAGTPGLPQRLLDADCTFTERTVERGIGLLDAKASEDAIRRPLMDSAWKTADESHLSIDDDALRYIVEDCQGYPYFLQLWGSALWDYAGQNSSNPLNLHDVQKVQDAVEIKRRQFYAKRDDELLSDDAVLVGANAVAGVFEKHQDAPSATDLLSAIEGALSWLESDPKGLRAESMRVLKQLIQRGFIWKPPHLPGLFTAGIPSYMSYAKELHDSMHRR